MPVSTNSNVNTKQSYIPPSLRNKNTSSRQSSQHSTSTSFAPSTKKTEPKKEFPQAEAFPTLGETITQKSNNNKNDSAANTTTGSKTSKNKSPISFSSAASKRIPEKKDTTPPPNKPLLMGWVYISKSNNNNGTITYKHNYIESPISKRELELAYQDNQRLGNILFKYRIAREQYERDMDVERLGDLSEYYNEPTLIEMYENDSNLCFNDDDFNFSDNDY